MRSKVAVVLDMPVRVATGLALIAGVLFSTLLAQPVPAAAQVDKVLYFSFDDGPHPEHSRELLDLFDQYGGKATFFVVSDWVDRYPEVVVETFNRGHSIQNHTQTHPRLSQLSSNEVRAELRDASETITRLTGVAPTCMRPPFRDTDNRIRAIAGELGLAHEADYISTGDSRQPGVAAIVNGVKSRAQPGSVILLHDGPFSEDRRQSVEATRQLLEHYAGQGYRFETMPRCARDDGGSGGDGGDGGNPGGGASTISVRAHGTTGTEDIDLRINGSVVESWGNISRTFTNYTATVPAGTTIDGLRLHFTNNGYHNGTNKNVQIDYVEFDGVRYQTEDPANESLGSWTPSTGCSQGNKSSAWINCNGWVDYAKMRGLVIGSDGDSSGGGGNGTAPNQPPIADAGPDQTIIDADGDGTETVEVSADRSTDSDGTIVGYEWRESGSVVSTAADPSLSLAIGTHTLELGVTDDDGASDSDTVVIVVDEGVAPPPPLGDGAIMVRARGTTGTEVIHLTINGVVVREWRSISTAYATHEASVPEGTTIDELRVHFTNNGFHNGANMNVQIDYVEVGGTRYQTEDPANESRGSWTPTTGCGQGFKASDWLNCNGWIDYAGARGATTGTGPDAPDGTNQAPVARTGDAQTLTDADEDGFETVDLDGSQSSDPDGTIVAYSWEMDSRTVATTARLTTSLPVGTHTLTLTVTDDDGASTSADVTVTVAAASAPPSGDVTITVRARGTTGTEAIHLTVNGQRIDEWQTGAGPLADHVATIPRGTTIDELRVHFTNNGFHNGANMNVQIDYVEVGGTRYQTEDPANESRGSWTPTTGCGQGFKASDWLNCNGWIDYAGATGRTG